MYLQYIYIVHSRVLCMHHHPDTASCQSQLLMLDQLRAVAAEESVQETLTRTSLLRLVDLTKLNSEEKRLCFFANVLNLAYLHTYMWFSSLGTSLQDVLGVTEEFVSLCACMQPRELDVCSHFGLFSQCGYTVGQLGTVRLVHFV